MSLLLFAVTPTPILLATNASALTYSSLSVSFTPLIKSLPELFESVSLAAMVLTLNSLSASATSSAATSPLNLIFAKLSLSLTSASSCRTVIGTALAPSAPWARHLFRTSSRIFT